MKFILPREPSDGAEELLALLAESAASHQESNSPEEENQEENVCVDKPSFQTSEKYFNPKISYRHDEDEAEGDFVCESENPRKRFKLNTDKHANKSNSVEENLNPLSDDTEQQQQHRVKFLGKSKAEFEDRLEIPYCYLCCDNLRYTKKGLLRHFHLFHLCSSVTYNETMSIKCHLNCTDSEEGHFHCPDDACSVVCPNKEDLEYHLQVQHMCRPDQVKTEPVDTYLECDKDIEDHTTIVISHEEDKATHDIIQQARYVLAKQCGELARYFTTSSSAK